MRTFAPFRRLAAAFSAGFAALVADGADQGGAWAQTGEEQTFRIAAQGEPTLFLRRRLPVGGRAAQSSPALYIHGATFPSALSIAYRFDGRSWMDDLTDAGFSVWALDFAGYGGSERYAEDSRPDAPAPGRAQEAARQIERAVAFITETEGAPKVSLIAHSWGTIVAGLYAGENARRIDRLVLFGPIAERAGERDATPLPSHRLITLKLQYDRFVADVPKDRAPVLRDFDRWGPSYLASDPESGARTPPAVKIPSGPASDLRDAWSGALPYDPGKITAPTLIVRGAWDSVSTDEDARRLFEALAAAPIKHDVKIGAATHLMHLEEGRFELYEATRSFLLGAGERKK